MTNTLTVEEQLAAELDAASKQAQERAQPMVSIALFPNTRRDASKNHAHYTGRATLSAEAVGKAAMEAIERGEKTFEVWINVWQNTAGEVSPTTGKNRPLLSGNGTKLVEPRPVADAATA